MRAAAVLVAIASIAGAADLPSTLVSDDEAEPIHSAILRGEAWTRDAVRRLRADAERRLKEGPWSVTSERPKGVDLDPHEYYSESPVWWPDPGNPAGPYIRREGQFNPDRFTANRTALNALGDTVFALGAAAYWLNDPRYAQRATRVIQTWFINPKTRMNPNLEHAQSIPGPPPAGPDGAPVPAAPQGPLPVETRSLIRAIQGMEFLAWSGEWDAKDQAAVHKWFEEYLRWLAPSQVTADRRTANERVWWAAETAAVASFVEETAATQRAFGFYRDRVFPREIRGQAGRGRGELRGRSPEILAADLEAVATVCRIAQVHGVDLWGVRARNGATIAGAFDLLGSTFAEFKTSARNQAASLDAGGLYFLAFAGMGLDKPDYIALFRRLERGDSAWLAMVDLLVGHWEAAGHQTRH